MSNLLSLSQDATETPISTSPISFQICRNCKRVKVELPSPGASRCRKKQDLWHVLCAYVQPVYALKGNCLPVLPIASWWKRNIPMIPMLSFFAYNMIMLNNFTKTLLQQPLATTLTTCFLTVYSLRLLPLLGYKSWSHWLPVIGDLRLMLVLVGYNLNSL